MPVALLWVIAGLAAFGGIGQCAVGWNLKGIKDEIIPSEKRLNRITFWIGAGIAVSYALVIMAIIKAFQGGTK